MGNLTLFEGLTAGAFDRLNWQNSGEFDQNFSKKSNARGFARGGGAWAVLELTGTLPRPLMILDITLTSIQLLFTTIMLILCFVKTPKTLMA